MRSVLQYPGSKWRIAGELVKRIPDHHTYVEPFFGSGAVFFSKEPSRIELINDLDDNVPNLFQCIRDDPEKLAALVAATPYSRTEYERAFYSEEPERFRKALDFLISCWQGHGFRTNGYRVGWKNDVQGRESMYALRNWYSLPERLLETAERLRQVQIENRPALEVIERFNYESAFIYIDPPYLLGTRTAKQYRHEMTDKDHERLLETVLGMKSRIMISGYESELYDRLLKDWNKEHFRGSVQSGKSRLETVWTNYRRPEIQQLNLFQGGNESWQK